MNKAYIIWPLVGLLVFGAFYWNFNKGFVERQRIEEAKVKEQRKQRMLAEAEARKKAIEAAIIAQQKRLADRAIKEKKEEEEKAQRAALIDRRNRAFDDVNKRLRPQLERLRNDAGDIKDQIAKLELEQKESQSEEAFLRDYVRKAEANVQSYGALLDQIAAADKARADAAAAAKAKRG